MVFRLVLLRHGESLWNKKNLFTGWANVPLTAKGREEARKAGLLLKKEGYKFDIAFTNLHARSQKTAEIVLQVLGLAKIPVRKSWRLNERHYGALIGLNKAETAKKYGDEQVHVWRRSYSARPPALAPGDKRHLEIARTYPEVPKKFLPLAESLDDTYRRSIPFLEQEILPLVKSGRRVLVVASHNSLRSLVKHLDKISEKEIPEYTIPTAVPLVYELDRRLKPIRHYYLGDSAEIRKSLADIAAQGRGKR